MFSSGDRFDSSVSLFGPGVGESICLNLGDDDWFVIDSCRDPASRRPAALIYLESLGLDPAKVVKGIVISHWHDDHVKGISDIVRVCLDARVYLSVALKKGEFLELTNIYSGRVSTVNVEDTGVNELQKVFGIILPRIKIAKELGAEIPVHFVGPNTVIFRKNDAEISTLSPSQGSIAAALDDFASHLDQARRSPRIIPRPSSNFCAIALHVRFKGSVSAILGADLETSKTNPLIGWDAVINSSVKPQSKAKFVKVPHHGSQTGHHDKFWTDLVSEDPVGFLTEFSPQSLPRNEDIRRLKSLTSELFCTTIPKVKLARRDKAIDKTMNDVAKSRRPLSSFLGRVTFYFDPAGNYEVDLGPNSQKL